MLCLEWLDMSVGSTVLLWFDSEGWISCVQYIVLTEYLPMLLDSWRFIQSSLVSDQWVDMSVQCAHWPLLDFVCVQLAVSVLGVQEWGMVGDSGKSTQYSPSILSHLYTRLNEGGIYSTIFSTLFCIVVYCHVFYDI